MVTLSDDEVALIRSLLTALRAIKIRDVDKALAVLAKAGKRRIWLRREKAFTWLEAPPFVKKKYTWRLSDSKNSKK